jgi:hypothetical protein
MQTAQGGVGICRCIESDIDGHEVNGSNSIAQKIRLLTMFAC